SRETSSPVRLRSWKPASRLIRCEYSRPRRSATTRSPNSETKKKRAAVAMASATATANSSMNARSMAPPPPSAKPWSIMVLNATGRLSVAADDAASANSQPANNARCLRTNGQRVRRRLTGALAGGAVSFPDSFGSVIPPLSAIGRRASRAAGGSGSIGDVRPVAGRVPQVVRQSLQPVGGQPQAQAGTPCIEVLLELLGAVGGGAGVDRTGVGKGVVHGAFRPMHQFAALG